MLTKWSIRIGVFSFIIQGIAFAADVKPVGFIDTPDACLVVNKVTTKEIHLVAAGVCNGKLGRAYVDIKPGEIRTVFADGRQIGVLEVRPLEVVDIANALAVGEKSAANMKLQENKHSGKMLEAATASHEYYTSEKFQQALQGETEQIKEKMFGKAASYYKDMGEVKTKGRSSLAEDERLYVFVSSSMPVHVLRTYAADIARLKDPRVTMVVRGFIDGMEKIGPTLTFFSEVLKKKPGCEPKPGDQCEMNHANLIVDPLLFRKYGVSQVPAFVYVKGVQFENPGMSEGVDDHISVQGVSYLMAGDASLGYIVSKFADNTNSGALKESERVLR